ncbi:hypothetical protein Q8W71_12935 [Methylobacterium sp. NEAU 140]|uniref:hypothetical protein n=1 Tax=Methylobacterium sp. NEAU 140 TaxID=3064945 RepID=UPI002735F67E|nr:hypothetical protein [Methylobacterium sp. NEAU 140]MDP4023536.1 hypothetical protein [Methylobacterium sp. NEAU 140]
MGRNLRRAALAALLAAPLPAAAQWQGPDAAPLFVNDGQPASKHNYNYAPSLIAEGDVVHIWWCGRGPEPTDTDVVFHRTQDRRTGAFGPARVVLRSTPDTWDKTYVCDPGVVKGRFTNPADGHSYTHALYYSGADNLPGHQNAVGLAFSNDGVTWVKYPEPVIRPQNTDPGKRETYGAGQPGLFNADGKAGLFVFTTDTTTPERPGFGEIFVRHTADGVHFDPPVRMPNVASDGALLFPNTDFAYDFRAGQVYTMAGLPGRGCTPPTHCKDPGKNPDRETYRMGLFAMPVGALLAGTGRWTPLGQLNTDVTGFYLNHSPGLLRDGHGNLTFDLPRVTVYFAGGDPYPGTWNIAAAVQTQASPTLPLRRALRPRDGQHWVSAGYIAPDFAPESVLGAVWRLREPGTAPLYSCQVGTGPHFLSRDPACEGQIVLGETGYVSEAPRPGTRPIYRCLAPASGSHFVSTDPACEGQRSEGPLGHVLAGAP